MGLGPRAQHDGVTLLPAAQPCLCSLKCAGKGFWHPLDPLTADEVTAAAGACKEKAASLSLPALRFNAITLREPAKRALLAWQKAGSPEDGAPPREAFCVLQTPGCGEQRRGACRAMGAHASTAPSNLPGLSAPLPWRSHRPRRHWLPCPQWRRSCC
jgi:hypothetical protein